MRTILSIVSMAIISIGIFLALLYAWQDKLILQPGIGGGSPDVLAHCAPGSARWQDRGQYRGKICEPHGAASATVLVYHGNAGSVDDRFALADALSRRGFRVVLLEYPGYGLRAGRASVNGALAAALDDFDVAAAKWPAPLYVLGESFGAGIAAEVASARRDKVAGVVLITPWDSLANVVDASFFHLPMSILLHQRFDIAAALSSYPGRVVIVGAEQDEVIAVRHARALAQALPQAAYQEIRGAGHNDWPVFMTHAHWEQVVARLRK